MTRPVVVSNRARKQLAHFAPINQKAFKKVLDQFQTADDKAQRAMLKNIAATHYAPHQVRWAIKAGRKHRLLVDEESSSYVVRAFVSRGDRHYYFSE
jgi:phage-related protein